MSWPAISLVQDCTASESLVQVGCTCVELEFSYKKPIFSFGNSLTPMYVALRPYHSSAFYIYVLMGMIYVADVNLYDVIRCRSY